MSRDNNEASPFAKTEPARATVSLWMLIFSLIVFAAFSMVMMFASRVPAITNSINDFFGLPQTAKADKPDRSAHLFFLLFCYSSPLLLAMWVGLFHVFCSRFFPAQVTNRDNEPDSPFA